LENAHKSASLASDRRWHALRFCLTLGRAHECTTTCDEWPCHGHPRPRIRTRGRGDFQL